MAASSTRGVEEDEEFEEKGLFFRNCSIFAEIYRALCSCFLIRNLVNSKALGKEL